MSNIQTTDNAVQGMAFKMPTAEQQAQLFADFSEKLAPYKEAAKSFLSLEYPTAEDIKRAKELRLRVVKIRTAAADAHKQAKADALAYGRALDNAKNTITEDCNSVEVIFEAVEKAAQRREAERVAALIAQRREALGEYATPSDTLLAGFSEEEFDDYLDGVKAKWDRAQEQAREQEAARIAAEKAERERIEAQRQENEDLKAEAALRAETLRKAEQAQAEARAAVERAEREANEAKEQADAQAQKIAEMQRIEAERIAEQKRIADAQAAKEAKWVKAYYVLSTDLERLQIAIQKVYELPADNEARKKVLFAILNATM